VTIDRPALTILGKPDCHLCHVMADVVRAVVGDRATLTMEDVRAKPEWQVYRYEIPVLFLGEQEIARHRITEGELKQRLAAAGLPL
jgi:Glutaredoxin-like domain (DUF836)